MITMGFWSSKRGYLWGSLGTQTNPLAKAAASACACGFEADALGSFILKKTLRSLLDLSSKYAELRFLKVKTLLRATECGWLLS